MIISDWILRDQRHQRPSSFCCTMWSSLDPAIASTVGSKHGPSLGQRLALLLEEDLHLAGRRLQQLVQLGFHVERDIFDSTAHSIGYSICYRKLRSVLGYNLHRLDWMTLAKWPSYPAGFRLAIVESGMSRRRRCRICRLRPSPFHRHFQSQRRSRLPQHRLSSSSDHWN